MHRVNNQKRGENNRQKSPQISYRKQVRKKSTEVTCPQITTFTYKARCGWVLSLIHHVKLIKWSVFTLLTIALIIIPLVVQIRPQQHKSFTTEQPNNNHNNT